MGSGDLTHVSVCCTQSNGLATYECDKLQRESRMDTRLSSLSHRFEQPRCCYEVVAVSSVLEFWYF